jgi:hypothetical protein
VLRFLRNAISKLHSSPADHLLDFRSSDVDGAGPVGPTEGYFQLQISEMFLSKDRKWWNGIVPSIQGEVRLLYGQEIVGLPCMVGPGRFSSNTTRISFTDQPLTDWLPYNDGTIEIRLALTAVKQINYLEKSLDALDKVAALVNVPQVSAVLTVARTVADVADDVMAPEDEDDLRPVLAVEFSLSADDPRSPVEASSFVILNSSDSKYSETDFEIRDGELYRDGQHFVGCDYMVVRLLTKRTKVWRTIPAIDAAIDAAVAKAATGTRQQAVALLYAAQAVVLDCVDLSLSDQERVVGEIWDHYNKHVPTNAQAPRGTPVVEELEAVIVQEIPDPRAGPGRGREGVVPETTGSKRRPERRLGVATVI